MKRYNPYTPIFFLEDVRRYVAEHNTHLSNGDRLAIASVPIIYKAISQDPDFAVARVEEIIMHAHKTEYSLGVTEIQQHDLVMDVKIYGCDHERDQVNMAFSLIHELAHVITPGGTQHSEKWAENARMLGICEVSYPGDNKTLLTKVEKDKWRWLDAALEAYVRSLPPVEWGNLDMDTFKMLDNELDNLDHELVHRQALKKG